MAVEARNFNLFPSQFIPNRDLVNSNQGNAFAYSTQMGSFAVPLPSSMPETLLPIYQTLDSAPAKTSVNTDSGLTYNLPPAPRKRSRESMNQFYATSNFGAPQKNNSISQFPSFVSEEVLPQIQQYQLEIDSIISQHTKRIKLELEEKQKQQARLLMSAIGEGAMIKLKEKEDQLQRMGKMNLVLQERVKSLFMENQLLRNLAQTNEATANSLRTNLEQVLAHVSDERLSSGAAGGGGAVEEDVESCCGNSDFREVEGEYGSRTVAECGGRMCRRCGERESCVLLLPCRHLCLCNICGSGTAHVQSCPVCKSAMTATLHVNTST
ncbi:BOI-related E3 ubiquitin- ligase 1-like [Olea europaea subsp. europaea]|uniref:BOI-related E3 ubiquitin- ligase 1-like n=2 Tax=Olea europaea subsp. europaea TaxID=158383 RepID=A0A8S0T7Z9_OLEEU|nr:BOI-related E3 ubiquitin- ligase 1-like [Olea europaea subsp. europaea]